MLKRYILAGVVCMTLFAVATSLTGCGTDRQAESANNAATGHEGHDHGPGEHGHATVAAHEADRLDWCPEHAVPESQCTKCNPDLIDDFKAADDWCAGHDLPESHCRLCNPGLAFPQEEHFRTKSDELATTDIEIFLHFRPNADICATDGALIQFASAMTARRAGIAVQNVRAAAYESVIDAPAEIVFDETAATVVTTTVPALVSRWLASPGDIVKAGDVMAILQSPDIARLKSDLVSAQAEYDVENKELDRHRRLLDGQLISQADFDRQATLAERARAELLAARGLLLSAGLNEADVDEVLRHDDLSNRFALRAPSSSMVVDRIAQLGELMDAGRAFARLADPTAMWIEASLTEEQARRVTIGEAMTFNSDGRGLNRVGGEIIWISSFLDPHTRTATVRAKVLDPDHRLQAGEFGRVKVSTQDDLDVVLVPKDAVQWEGCCNVVFVKESDDRYRPRKVRLLDGDGPYYQVTEGVKPGEQVVVGGSFLLKTELKKSSIGAGCCGLEPVG